MNSLQKRIDPAPLMRYPSLAEFENGDLDPNTFTHAAHVYVTWQLLDECALLDAIQRFAAALVTTSQDTRTRQQWRTEKRHRDCEATDIRRE